MNPVAYFYLMIPFVLRKKILRNVIFTAEIDGSEVNPITFYCDTT